MYLNPSWMTRYWLQLIKPHRLQQESLLLVSKISVLAIFCMKVELQFSICLQFLFERLINIFGVNQEIEPFLRCLIQMLDHVIC